MRHNLNSYPLRYHTTNNRPYPYLSNYSDISHNSNQKILTVERNLNDLKLDTETELSRRGSDFSFVLDGLKREIEVISQNMIETDKKAMEYTQKKKSLMI